MISLLNVRSTYEKEFLPRIKGIGRVPICNLKVTRAPRVGKLCFPLCWRCTAILFPYVLLNNWVDVPNDQLFVKLFALILMLPTSVDGILQYRFKRESNNARRIFTGL